jgi:hypothetical protein
VLLEAPKEQEKAMRFARLTAVTAVLFATLGSARADAFIPGNYIDDFGSLVPSAPARESQPVVASHASPIPGNYVDDFGSLVPSAPARESRPVVASHASPIPGNYIDDFGLGDSTSQSRSSEDAIAQAQAYAAQ